MSRKSFQIFIEVTLEANGTGAWGLALVSDEGTLLSEYTGGAKNVANHKPLMEAAVSAVIELASPQARYDFYVLTSMVGTEKEFIARGAPSHIIVLPQTRYAKDSWGDYAIMLARVGTHLIGKNLVSQWSKTKVKTADIQEVLNDGKVERTDRLPRSLQHGSVQRR